jgi:hypothetical protein
VSSLILIIIITLQDELGAKIKMQQFFLRKSKHRRVAAWQSWLIRCSVNLGVCRSNLRTDFFNLKNLPMNGVMINSSESTEPGQHRCKLVQKILPNFFSSF